MCHNKCSNPSPNSQTINFSHINLFSIIFFFSLRFVVIVNRTCFEFLFPSSSHLIFFVSSFFLEFSSYFSVIFVVHLFRYFTLCVSFSSIFKPFNYCHFRQFKRWRSERLSNNHNNVFCVWLHTHQINHKLSDDEVTPKERATQQKKKKGWNVKSNSRRSEIMHSNHGQVKTSNNKIYSSEIGWTKKRRRENENCHFHRAKCRLNWTSIFMHF